MVDINLIPAALRKNGKENVSLSINIPQEILLGVGSGVILLLLTVHLLLGFVWLIGLGQLSAHQAQWQKLASDKTLLDGIYNETKDLKTKIDLISGMTTKKAVSWAPKFNAISDALPRGLWIRKMALDKTGLSMEGSVVSKTRNEINNVGLFIYTLKQNNDFMKDFSSLEVNSIQRGNANAIEVTDFTVMAKLNETGPKLNKILEQFNNLNDQARYGILGGVVFFIILLDVFLLVMPQLGGISDVNDQIKKMSDDTQRVLTDRDRISQLRKNLQGMRGQLSSLSDKVRPIQEVPAILSTISSVANEYSVKIDQLLPEKSQQEDLKAPGDDKYYSLPIMIKARCGYHMFGRFINKLENENMYFIVKDFIIQNDDKSVNTHSFSLTINLILVDKH